MGWQVVQADARSLPLAGGSVDLIVTSPPYWGLRSYRDGGEHYDGQVGAESTPQQYVDELVGMIDSEWRRVLKPCGSLWLNLGDKYAGAGGSGTTSGLAAEPNINRGGNGSYPKGTERVRAKSLLGLPWRVALALIDRGWILRAEVIWSKPNGLPESVTDRVRRSHEQWFHFVLEGSYFSAVDEIREPHAEVSLNRVGRAAFVQRDPSQGAIANDQALSPLGRLPGSVRTVPTQPLIIPDPVKEQLGLVDHFAAFPMEWPRWIIQGWSPREVCTVCGEGRRPVTERKVEKWQTGHKATGDSQTFGGGRNMTANRGDGALLPNTVTQTIVGYSCACPEPRHINDGGAGWGCVPGLDTDCQIVAHYTEEPAPPTHGVVLDPFGGTGTVAGVAHMLGRTGISVDLSEDYCRLARWRIGESGDFARAEQKQWESRQEAML